MVGVTGLEPATSCTPSKHSSHLSYTPTSFFNFSGRASFCQAADRQSGRLPEQNISAKLRNHARCRAAVRSVRQPAHCLAGSCAPRPAAGSAAAAVAAAAAAVASAITATVTTAVDVTRPARLGCVELVEVRRLYCVSRMDRLIRPWLSISITLTRTGSPSLTTSSTFSTRFQASLEM